MIYQLHELHHASLIPMRLWATATMALYGGPFSPFRHNLVSRMIVAGADVLLRATDRYSKPHFGLTETVVDGRPVAVFEEKVAEKPFCTLVHFRRETEAKQPTVLVVAPLSGH